VEEFLRFVISVQFTKPRFLRKNVEVGGVRLKKSDTVMSLLLVRLRMQVGGCHEKLDLERRPNRHLALGAGTHFCLGHQLARIEGACALKSLFRHWPKPELAVDESLSKWRRRGSEGDRAVAGSAGAVAPFAIRMAPSSAQLSASCSHRIMPPWRSASLSEMASLGRFWA
jgi:cytochrome P450